MPPKSTTLSTFCHVHSEADLQLISKLHTAPEVCRSTQSGQVETKVRKLPLRYWQSRSLDVCVLSDLLQGGPHLARPGGDFGAGLLSLDASSVGLTADAAGGSKGATAMHPMHPAMAVGLAI